MAIKAKLKTKSPCEVLLEAEVPRPELTVHYENMLARMSRHAELPGFRAGKVPRALLEERFGKDIEARTMEEVVVGIIRAVIKQHGLEPVTGPRFPKDPEYPKDGPLAFTAEFEVEPAVRLKAYKGLALATKKTPITDDEVKQVIERMLDQHATYDELTEDRPIAYGDWVVADYSGALGGQEKLKRAAAWIEVSSSYRMPVPGFADELVGMKKGETKKFSISAPTDFYLKEAAGMLLDFSVTLSKILERKRPLLTDELAAKIDPQCRTVKDLRSAIVKNQEKYRELEEQRRLGELAREALVKEHPLPLPPSQVAQRARRLIENEARARMRRGETE